MSIASRVAELVKHCIVSAAFFTLFVALYTACKCLNISKGLK